MFVGNLLCISGIITALFTVFSVARFLSRDTPNDGGFAFGMFLMGTLLTMVQLGFWFNSIK